MPELPHSPGQIISYIEMCQAWSRSFQHGMNFRVRPNRSVILMSRRPNAPYRDRIEHDGRVLIYEGHDVPRTKSCLNPKSVDQPRQTPRGKPTPNGFFEDAAIKAKRSLTRPAVVAVYEKIHQGIWAFNGMFLLTDAWLESDGERKVFKFRLELSEDTSDSPSSISVEIEHNRIVPSTVKLEVWKRDKGKCVLCGASDNLHFDHDLPFSKGGTSLTAENIRLLCARHNLMKRNNIE